VPERHGRKVRRPAALEGIAEVGALILLSLISVPITVGIPFLVVRFLAPGSTGRALQHDPSPAVAAAGQQLTLASSITGSSQGTSGVGLAFRVRNLTMGKRTLRWTVTTLSAARSTTVAGSGSLALVGGASQVVRVHVSCRTAPSRIDVSLGDANQTIGVRAPCQRPPAPAAAPGTLLTFVNPTHPLSQRANAAVRFAFKVDNHTHVGQSYVWTAMTQTHGRSPVDAATGHLTLPSYYFAVVPVSVRLVCVGLQIHVSVALARATRSGAVQTISVQAPCRRNRV
jgi:hypothetical protein